MEWLNELLTGLDKIQGLSAVALVCFSCVVVGYVLRFIKPFPNSAIPVVVILWGAVAMLFLADPRPTTMPARIWTGRNFCVGLVLGLIAWLLHYALLSKIEDFIASRFPGSRNTQLFSHKPDEPTDTSGQRPPTDPDSKP